MTVDQMLIYIPQIRKQQSLLLEMRMRMPKKRLQRNSQIIDYEYINYDLKEVSAEYDRVSDELARAQIALDGVNAEAVIEFEI